MPSPLQSGKASDMAFWTEFALPGQALTVVAVRGTEFWRLSDYLEDVRMCPRLPTPSRTVTVIVTVTMAVTVTVTVC